MEDLKSFIEDIQRNTVTFWLGVIAGVLLILLVRFALQKILKRKFEKHKTKLFMDTILNWITLFVLVLYFFTYFSKSTFIYQTLFVFGDTRVSIFLVLTLAFAILLAVKFSKAIQDFILPIFYERYELDGQVQHLV